MGITTCALLVSLLEQLNLNMYHVNIRSYIRMYYHRADTPCICNSKVMNSMQQLKLHMCLRVYSMKQAVNA